MAASVCVAAGLLAQPAVHATTITYADFSSVAGLQLNGSAAQAGNVLRLTPSAPGQGGSAFYNTAIPLNAAYSFSSYFQFRISNPGGIGDGDGQGADGLVFVVQTNASNVGGAGGGIGYLGIPNSVGIEFDTYNNGEINGNHVGIDLNGSVNSITNVAVAQRLNDGDVWNAWVDYNGATDDLEVRLSLGATRPAAAILAANIDLTAVLGSPNAFVGFTSGTGSGYGDHDILSWEFRDTFDPITPGAVPLPGSLALLGIGVASLLAGRRSRARK